MVGTEQLWYDPTGGRWRRVRVVSVRRRRATVEWFDNARRHETVGPGGRVRIVAERRRADVYVADLKVPEEGWRR